MIDCLNMSAKETWRILTKRMSVLILITSFLPSQFTRGRGDQCFRIILPMLRNTTQYFIGSGDLQCIQKVLDRSQKTSDILVQTVTLSLQLPGLSLFSNLMHDPIPSSL